MPTVGNQVEVKYGTQDTYNDIIPRDSTIYFITDTKRIYVGDSLYGAQSGYVTPEMFGALCDGVTDDAEAIEDMYNYANQKNLVVYISSKVLVSGRVFIQADTYGVGEAEIVADDFIVSGSYIINEVKFTSSMTPSGESEDILMKISAYTVSIEGCTFEFSTDNGNALGVKGVSNADIRIDKCKFNKCSTNFSGCKHVSIQNSVFNMNYVNSGHECVQFTAFTPGEIINNEFYQSEGDFIDLYSAGMDCKVSGNTFDGCHSHNMIEAKTTIRSDDEPGGSSRTLGYCRRNIITNNHFKNFIAKDAGIYSFICITVVYDGDFPDSIEDYPGEDIVKGNIFEGCSRINDSIQPTFFGICCCGRNTIISNNVVDITEPVSTGKSACILVGTMSPNAVTGLKTQNIVVANNTLGGNSFGVLVRTNGPNINIVNNVSRSDHSLKFFIRIGTTVTENPTVIDVNKVMIKDNSCSEGSDTSFNFLYSNANLVDFEISGNITNKRMEFTCNLTKGVINNNVFDLTEHGIYLGGTITSVIFTGNFFNTTSSTAGSIYASTSTTFAYCTINGNLSRGRELLRYLGTGTTPVMVGNVVANAENNSIKTT